MASPLFHCLLSVTKDGMLLPAISIELFVRVFLMNCLRCMGCKYFNVQTSNIGIWLYIQLVVPKKRA
jgi:hypothetical protein